MSDDPDQQGEMRRASIVKTESRLPQNRWCIIAYWLDALQWRKHRKIYGGSTFLFAPTWPDALERAKRFVVLGETRVTAPPAAPSPNDDTTPMPPNGDTPCPE